MRKEEMVGYFLTRNFINFMSSFDENFSPSVILDIGSRDAEQSVEFSKVFPESKIFAFEPNPHQFKICEQNAFQRDNIVVENLALSKENGRVKFYLTPGNIGASSLLKPIAVPFGHTQEFYEIEVESVSLSDWCIKKDVKKIDVMWMDAQGIELDILQSISGDVLENVSFIHCEAAQKAYYETHRLKDELEKFLNEKGFQTTFVKGAYHPFDEGDLLAVNKRKFGI